MAPPGWAHWGFSHVLSLLFFNVFCGHSDAAARSSLPSHANMLSCSLIVIWVNVALPNGHVVILGMGGTGVAQAWAAEGSGSGSEMSPQEKRFMQNSALWSQFIFFFLNKNHLWPQLCFFLTVSLFSILSLDTSIPPFLPFCHYWLVTIQSTHLSFFPWSFLHPEPPLPPTPPHCVAAAQHHLQQMHEQDLLVVQVLFLLSVLHCISIVVHWVAFVTLDLFSLPSQGQNRWTARCACGYTTNTCSCCFLLHLLRFRCTWSQILLLLVILLLVVIGVSGKPVQVCCMCKPVFPKQARWA